MRAEKYLQITSNLFRENMLLKFVITALTVSTVTISFLMYRQVKEQRVIIVPAGLSQKVEVSSTSASEAYLEHYARYISGLFFNCSPSSVRKQYELILNDVHPSSYGRTKEMLYDLAEKIEISEASSVFYIKKISYFKKDNSDMIEIEGLRSQYKYDRLLDTASKTYYIAYKIESGRFYIMDIAEKVEAKTKEDTK